MNARFLSVILFLTVSVTAMNFVLIDRLPNDGKPSSNRSVFMNVDNIVMVDHHTCEIHYKCIALAGDADICITQLSDYACEDFRAMYRRKDDHMHI